SPSAGAPSRCRCSSNSAGSGWMSLVPNTRNHMELVLQSTRGADATPLARGARLSLAPRLILGDLRVADGLEQLVDDVLAGLSFGLGLEVGADAVAENGDSGLLDVVDGHAEPAVHGGEGLAGLDQVNLGARAGPPVHHLFHELRGAGVPRPAGA